MAEQHSAALGTLVRRFRGDRALTQEDLAERVSAGLSVKTVGNIERGRHRPQRHVIEAIVGALELSAGDRRAVIDAWRRSAPGSSSRRPASVNQPLTPLIGREEELGAVRRLIHAGARLITLTGPAGAGKTRLALQVLAEEEAHFPDGVAFVALDAVGEPRMVLNVIGEALGIRESVEQRTDSALHAFLASRRILIALDNFEQIVEAAPRIAELVQACPGVHMLVTSRVALRLRGEQEFAVPPLPLPTLNGRNDIDAIGASAAVRLFMERAKEIVPDFTITSDNAQPIAEICARLDGLPLAIELAVPWLKIWSPTMLLGRLGHSLRLLADGARDMPERQQTLRDALAWSHNLLGAEEQTFFRRLAVFAGGWTVAAAAAVHGASPEEEAEIWADLARLHAKNIVRRRDGIDGESRFGMLHTMREFALERLAESGEAGQIRRRHAAFYLALAEQESELLIDPREPVWIDRLDIERDNFHVAMSWASEHDLSMAMRLGAVLWRCWVGRGYARRGREWLASLLDRPEARTRSLLRARALLGLSGLCWAVGDQVAAAGALREAAEIGTMLGDSRLVAAARNAGSAIARVERRVEEPLA